MTALLENRQHVQAVREYYRNPLLCGSLRRSFRRRVISAYERGDLRELEYLRQVRGI